jgi:hypothetical protein
LKRSEAELRKDADYHGPDTADLHMSANGDFGGYGEAYKLYKGDFSNENADEYALVSTGGSMGVSDVYVYKRIGDRLVNARLDQTIIANVMPGGEMKDFHFWVADPFAIVRGGKVYLRYMDYPGEGRYYDKSQLRLCTYLWEKNRFALTGPNLRFRTRNAPLSQTKECR